MWIWFGLLLNLGSTTRAVNEINRKLIVNKPIFVALTQHYLFSSIIQSIDKEIIRKKLTMLVENVRSNKYHTQLRANHIGCSIRIHLKTFHTMMSCEYGIKSVCWRRIWQHPLVEVGRKSCCKSLEQVFGNVKCLDIDGLQ